MLTPRWTPLRFHVEQSRLWHSPARFKITAAGRRSGKTELAKRELELAALEFAGDAGRFVAAAPTHAQAKKLFWEDLKALMPRKYIVGKPHETSLTIKLVNGATIEVASLDEPARIEGTPIDGIIIDEFANVKPNAWPRHVRPALSTPGRKPGWAWIFGVPEGRNHFWEMWEKARASNLAGDKSWDAFWWPSADILDPEELEAARREVDELTFAQEYGASFVNFAGRAYYKFEAATHACERIEYDPACMLDFMLDFNVEPGVAAVGQEMPYKGVRANVDRNIMGFIGEVWIPRNSNTEAVTRRLVHDWGHHKGMVRVYGDSTGGGRHTSQTRGTDWDQVFGILRGAFPGRVIDSVVTNPPERARVNAMNSRIMSIDGVIHVLVDPVRCKRIIEDLEGTLLLEGGSGELLKEAGSDRTHMTDGMGYWAAARFGRPGHAVVQMAVLP